MMIMDRNGSEKVYKGRDLSTKTEKKRNPPKVNEIKNQENRNMSFATKVKKIYMEKCEWRWE